MYIFLYTTSTLTVVRDLQLSLSKNSVSLDGNQMETVWRHVLNELDSDESEPDEEEFRAAFEGVSAKSGKMWSMEDNDGTWGERLIVDISTQKVK